MRYSPIIVLLAIFLYGCGGCDKGPVVANLVVKNSCEADIVFSSHPQIYATPISISRSAGAAVSMVSYEVCEDNQHGMFKTNRIFQEDTIRLADPISKRLLLFINPALDGSADLNARRDIHWWNYDNWYQEEEDGDFYFNVTQEMFDKYGQTF